MLIEIESVYGDKIIHGRHLSINELKSAMEEILEIVNEKDFTPVFCSRFQYEVIPLNDIPQKNPPTDFHVCRGIFVFGGSKPPPYV